MEDNNTKKSERATQEQLNLYVSFCKEHPAILAGKNNPTSPNAMRDMWQELASKLNALRGPSRVSGKWKENLSVWKCQLRARARKIKMNQRLTGGGSCGKSLSEFEERALAVFGKAAVEGSASIRTNGITINNTINENISEQESDCLSQTMSDLPHDSSDESPQNLPERNLSTLTSTLESPLTSPMESPSQSIQQSFFAGSITSCANNGHALKLDRQTIYNAVMNSLQQRNQMEQMQKEEQKKREEQEATRIEKEQKMLETLNALAVNVMQLTQEFAKLKAEKY